MSVMVKPLFTQLVTRAIKLKKELFWVVLGQFVAFVGGFAGIKLLTTVMGPEGYGQLALGLTISGVINLFVFGPLSQAVLRFFSVYRERNQLKEYFLILKKLHFGGGGSIFLLASLISLIVYYYTDPGWALLIFTASIFGVVGGFNASMVSLQSAARQRKAVAFLQGLDSLLRPALALLILYLGKNTGYSALTGYILGTIILFIPQYRLLKHSSEISSNWSSDLLIKAGDDEFREIILYILPFVGFALFVAIGLYSDRWIIQAVLGLRMIGIYAAIYQIANAPVMLVTNMIYQLMIPIIYDCAGTMTSPEQADKSHNMLWVTVLGAGVVMAVICILMTVFGETLLQMVTTHEFATNHSVMGVITVGLSLFNLAQILSIKGAYCNKPHIYLMPKMCHSLSFVLLGYLGVIFFGIMGIGIALCVSSLIYLFMIFFFNSKLENTLNLNFSSARFGDLN